MARLFSSVALAITLATNAHAQSINGLGVSGGDGPRGGIGDGAHVVRKAQSFITDAQIQAPNTNTTRQLAEGPAPVLTTSNDTSDCSERRVVVIDTSPSGAQQEMVGFGHSITDSTVSTFNSLEPEVFDQLMQDLFGQNGNNMGFMRNTMGSSDLSGPQYSFDDNGPSFNEGEPDLDLVNFSLGPYGTAMAEFIAKMGQYKGDVFLYSAPWSLPGWMKNNDLFIAPIVENYDGSAYPLLNNSFNINLIPQAIDYYTKYIDAYKSYGVTVNGLSMANEPLNYQGGYPTMYLEGADEAALLNQGLGKALLDRGVLAMAYDHNTDQPAYPYRVLQGAPGLVRSVAWHCYANPPNYTVIQDILRAFPDAIQFMTECTSYLPTVGTMSFQVAQSFMLPVQYGASGASMWVLGTDPDYGPHSPYGGCDGCEGSIIVNSTTTYTKTHDYFMVGQFSRFVRRGSINHRVLQGIEGNGYVYGDQFYINAFQNPDLSWTVIFMNNLGNTDDQEVALSFSTLGEQVWHGTIPAKSVVTWLLPSQQVLGESNRTAPYNSLPPYPLGNSTSVSAPSGGNGSNGTASSTLISACGSTAMSSSAAATSTGSVTVVPVPDVTHSFASITATDTVGLAPP
ncbi:hypothetical protein LTR62_001902 [Meristemomyces frigidus]|uniref:Glycoside hydrolase family 30 protein n=1 Tax=Meristemomyces frigidus TaxID=1508187 RepID=A0AAN7TJH8_9PEZI|nr:hypothetical protein LTR62_001902 [Meristemomyces frigidus]